MKIYDGFLFDNEFELLELRLQEHWDYVDKFILVECAVNHRDQPKPLLYAENRSRFAPWADKIQHIVMPYLAERSHYEPGKRGSGSGQDQQRNMIAWGLYDANPDDVLLICDVDEIWRKSALKYIKENPQHAIYAPKQMMAHFKMNFICKTHTDTDLCHGYMSWSKGIKIQTLKDNFFSDPTMVKASSEFSTVNQIGPRSDWLGIIQHGGWHFSWWGDKSDHIRKLEYYGHQDHDTIEMRRLISEDRLIPMKLAQEPLPQIGNIFPDHEWAICEVDDYFPETITNNMTKYRRHILPNPSCKATDILPNLPIGRT